ncbi:MAG: DUF4153 domain-containing protein [Hyphomonadaceae bacterium]|nr:DUF4153 domain-containing protein [Clostridia bacterium]
MDEHEKNDQEQTLAETEQSNEAIKTAIPQMKQNKHNLWGWIKKCANGAFGAFFRFPLPVLFCIVIAAIFITRIAMPYDFFKDIDEKLSRISMVLGLGVIFTLSIQLLMERFSFHAMMKSVIYVIEVLCVYLYFRFLMPNFDMIHVIRFGLIAFAFALMFYFMAYWFKRENLEIYVTKLISKKIVTVLYAVVLGLGLSLTLFTIKSLLYSGLDNKWYAYSWIAVWLIFAPIYFLSGIPKMDEEMVAEDYSKVLKVLLLYILMPLMTIYSIVLYLYFGKIIASHELPIRLVAYLVVSYTAIGAIVIFLITPLRDLKWVRVFTNTYTKIIFPLLAMMFVSICSRILTLGFTENRYFILVIGIWATLAMFYLNFNKGKYNIVLPFSLAVVALLTICGPWNAFNVSKASQNQHLYQMLSKYNMIENGVVVNKQASIDEQDKLEISGVIDYFDRTHKGNGLKYLPANFKKSQMKEVFGFEFKNGYYDENGDRNRHFNYNNEMMSENQTVQVTGYDYLLKVSLYQSDNNPNKTLFTDNQFAVKRENNVVILLQNQQELIRYDYSNDIKKLTDLYGSDSHKIPENLFVFNAENDKVKVKIILKDMSGLLATEQEGVVVEYLNASVLLKIK